MRNWDEFVPVLAGNQDQAENGHQTPKMGYYQNRSEMKSKQILEVLSCLGSKKSIYFKKTNFCIFCLEICCKSAIEEIGKKRYLSSIKY